MAPKARIFFGVQNMVSPLMGGDFSLRGGGLWISIDTGIIIMLYRYEVISNEDLSGKIDTKAYFLRVRTKNIINIFVTSQSSSGKF